VILVGGNVRPSHILSDRIGSSITEGQEKFNPPLFSMIFAQGVCHTKIMRRKYQINSLKAV
jgi:hypothetical protein